MTTSGERHWAGMEETTVVFGIRLLYWVYRLGGRWPFRVCLYPVVLGHWLSRPAVRQASLQYLQRLQASTGALGHEPGRWDSVKHMLLFAETMLDKALAVSGRYPSETVQTENREDFYRRSEKKQGGIIVTAHLGCLELCRAMAHERGAVKMHVLVHTRHAVRFNQILKRLNPSHDVGMLEVTDFGPQTATMLNERVAAGEYIVIAGDRVPVVASKTVEVDFLGHRAPFPVGAYVLAFTLGCPLYLLGCIHRPDGGYVIRFEVLAEQVKLPRATRDAAMTSYAQLFADRVTALLIRAPYDWFNFFPFWDQPR